MKPAVIKRKEQYQDYLARIEELVFNDPTPESDEGAELELPSLLVEEYEKKSFPFEMPDPVEAVEFRMHEQDLKQVDLVPYFGSRSRVSEFLSRQRPLTVGMIRDLSNGLGIPAEILLQDSVLEKNKSPIDAELEMDWSKFPVREMVARGWILTVKRKADTESTFRAVQQYVEAALGVSQSGLLARRTIRGDAFSWPASYALTAWQARVLEKASKEPMWNKRTFDFNKLDEEFIRNLVSLSRNSTGPMDAASFLRDAGIAVVIEDHLPKTKLDGAAMLAGNGTPVIGLTLRFDRLDNFWFTLLHELAHIWKHLSKPGDVFLDRLVDKKSTDSVEKEADRCARDWLISRASWKSALVRQMPTKAGIIAFAAEQKIHPAIVAGRIQNETENYALFPDLVGRGEVRKQFAKM